MVFAQSVCANMSGVKCLITTGPHSISVMPLFIKKSHVYKDISIIHMRGMTCSMTTQMWLKRKTKKSDMVILHLSHQPLFHFHHIRASQLHHTKHISAGANISFFHLPQQAGRIFHQNRPLSSHLRDTALHSCTTGSWSCSK